MNVTENLNATMPSATKSRELSEHDWINRPNKENNNPNLVVGKTQYD